MKNLFFLALALIMSANALAQRPFITTWKTDNSGSSNSTSITIPTVGSGYNYDVDWNNDGTFDQFGVTGSVTHDYGTAGTYTVAIRGNFPRIYFDGGGDSPKLLSIDQWGSIAWTNMNSAFYGCINMVLNATDVPNTEAVTDMSEMFRQCRAFNQALPEGFNTANVTNMSLMFNGCSSYNQVLPNSFNTAAVTDMSLMFAGCSSYNRALPSSFNTVNVTDMEGMFLNCSVYDQVLPSSFNTAKVTNMGQMFQGCSTYNQVLPSSFNTAAVTNMQSMFARCSIYNQPLPSSFNTAAVTNMTGMFSNCSMYDQALPSSFNTSAVTNMSNMFAWCSVYNQALPSSFNTAAVTDMSLMFFRCSAFNQPLPSSFNTTRVTNMSAMFSGCSTFNQALPSSFNTAAVIVMSSMFANATSFNQNLGSLNIGAATFMDNMLRNSGLSVANYDATLTGWDNGGYTNKNLADASPLQYCAAQSARDNLTNNKGWTITGDVLQCSSLTLGTATSPATCGGTGSIAFTSTGIATGSQTLSYKKNTVSATATVTVANDGSFTLTGLGAGEYSDFAIGATAATGSRSLNLPTSCSFVTTWKTDNAPTLITSITIPTTGTGYNYDVDWNNDGTYDEFGLTGNATHDYGTAGTYTVAIRGAFPRIFFDNDGDNNNKLISVDQWGEIDWKSFERAFLGCNNLEINASDTPDLNDVTNMSGMFVSIKAINQDITGWDVSNVTNMQSIFNGISSFNQNISNWNVSNVTDMALMFGETPFNQNISSWDVSKVTNMTGMFLRATAFNQNLGAWGAKFDTNVDLTSMLDNCGMSVANYDATLTGFNAGTVTGRTLGAEGLQYCAAKADRDNLVLAVGSGGKGWTITGDTRTFSCQRPFITTWKTDNAGTSNSTSITIPTTGTGYNYDVDWNNDGTYDEFGLTGNATHDYGTAGTYTVAIRGDFPRIYFNIEGDRRKLLSIQQWGSIVWASMEKAFWGCENLVLNATDVPNTAAVTNMSFMFANCRSLNQALPQGFNTAAVTDMSYMFDGCTIYNQVLPSTFNTAQVTKMNSMFSGCSDYNKALPSSFSTVSVTDMSNMFYRCIDYNQPLPSSFNTAAVTNMRSMFDGCSAYNKALPSSFNTAQVTNMRSMFDGCFNYNHALPSSFNTAAVTDMIDMFADCRAYNQVLPASFNTEKVTNMRGMFDGCIDYNQALPSSFNTAAVTDMSNMFNNCLDYNQALPANFNTAAVTNMARMFYGCSKYNQAFPSSFTTAAVTNMSSMFRNCRAFNQNIGTWNTAAVTDMSEMFFSARAFNQNISTWNTAAVTNMTEMLTGATAFNQNLGALNITAATSMTDMLRGTGLSVANYDATLMGWNNGGYTDKDLGDASPLQYCAAASARDNLINNKGWTIREDVSSTVCLPPAFTGMPSSVSVCAGVEASFSVTVSYGSTYAWQVNTGSGFVNLATGGVYSSVNSTTLNISNVTGLNGYQYRCVASNTNGDVNSDAATLTVNSLPTLPVVTPSAQCGGSLNLSTAFSSNGTLSYFTDGGFTSSATNPVTTSGTYYARAVSSASCSATASVSITINSSATISVSTPAAQCGGSLNLSTAFSSNGSLSYFTDGGFTSSATNPVTTSGTYYARTTLGSCTNSASVVITINALPTISVSVPSAQCGGSVNLSTAFSSNGTLSYFTDGGFTSSANNPVTTSGTYYARTTLGSCTNSASAVITINALPTISVSVPAAQCGGSVNLSTAFSSNGTLSYFTDSGFTSSATNPVTTSGTYYARTTLGSCTNSASVVITINALPTISVSVPAAQCGGSINLSTAFSSNGTLSYFQDDGFCAPAINPVTSSGTYYAQAVLGNCVSTASVSVNISSSPSVNVGSLTPLVCVGGNISLTASGGGSGYTWQGPAGSGYSSNNQNPSFTASSTTFGGTYSLTVQYPGGCTASNTTSVQVNSGPSVSSNNPVCAGNTLQLSASGGCSSYSWSGPSFSSTAQNPSRASATTGMSGTYSVRIASTAGCTGTVTLTVSVVVSPRNAIPTVTSIRVNGQLPNNQNTVSVLEGAAINFSVTAFNAVTYSWRSSTGFSSMLQNPSIANASVANAGQYVVVAQNGCQFFGARTVNVAVVRSSRIAAAKEETKLSLQLSVAPNPVTDWLAIRTDGVGGSQVYLRVVDVQGRSVLGATLEPVEGKAAHRFDLRPLPVGLYLLEAEDQHGQRATVKVVKY